MKDKNLPNDYNSLSLEELTLEANKMIKDLENQKDLENSLEKYQNLIKLNNIIEKKFQKNIKDIKITSKVFYKIFNFLTGFNFDGDTYLKMFTFEAKNKILKYCKSDVYICAIF